MISVLPFHRQVLQSLAEHGLEPSPSNLMRVIELLGQRWDLSPDELVRASFLISDEPKTILKIDFKIKNVRRKRLTILFLHVRFIKDFSICILL